MVLIWKQFAQELLSTFSTQLGEVALVPATGGVFTVTMYHSSSTTSTSGSSAGTAQGEEVPVPVVVAGTGNGNEEEDDDVTEIILWDRKTNGGFPGMLLLSFLLFHFFISVFLYFFFLVHGCRAAMG